MILTLAIGLGAAALIATIALQWFGINNTRDLGTMSRQWVVEQSAQHPMD